MFWTRCWVRSGSIYVRCLKITRSVSTWNIDSQEHEQCSVSFALIESYLLRSETEPQGEREGGRDGYGWVEWYCRLCSVNGGEKHEIPSELCTLGRRPALPLPHWFSSGKKSPDCGTLSQIHFGSKEILEYSQLDQTKFVCAPVGQKWHKSIAHLSLEWVTSGNSSF